MAIIPNAYQKPNFYTDKLAFFLTPTENLVLDRVIREILGWNDRIELRTAYISLSVIVDGRFRRGMPKTEENRLSYGCGVNMATARKALKKLVEFGVLIDLEKTNSKGKLIKIQTDDTLIDWEKLTDRKDRKREESTKKTAQITSEKPVTPYVQREGCYPLRATSGVNPPLTCNERGYPLRATSPNKANRKPNIKNTFSSSQKDKKAEQPIPENITPAERDYIDSGWGVDDWHIQTGIIIFWSVMRTHWSHLPKGKRQRRLWEIAIKEHLEEFEMSELGNLYEQSYKRLSSAGLSLSSPASFTKTMLAIDSEKTESSVRKKNPIEQYKEYLQKGIDKVIAIDMTETLFGKGCLTA